jgi:hypothetical protein
MHQLEDARANGLNNRVGTFPLAPGSGSHRERAVCFHPTWRPLIARAIANVLFSLEQAEDLNVAVLLVPSRPPVELAPRDGTAELRVKSDFLWNRGKRADLLFEPLAMNPHAGAESAASVEPFSWLASARLQHFCKRRIATFEGVPWIGGRAGH